MKTQRKMKGSFYVRLALNNLRKNAKAYLPYLLTCFGTIAMFYNMCFLMLTRDIGPLSNSVSLRQILMFGAVIIGIFSAIFLLYTNSFLVKRRQKEFGLFNILGMEKRHVARIMALETLFTSAVSLVIGILTGILLSKLMLLLLFKILSANITFGFEIPGGAIRNTLCLFGIIFGLTLIYNIAQVYRAKPVELLRGGLVGEKEPRTKWVLAVIGILCLGAGYYLALTTEAPLAALGIFFLAVLLVMIGTYCLFTAGSIAVLKLLRRNKQFYYQSRHFIPVSGMIYRMKQNAIGLANICILSSAVIVVLSTTVSLYVGMEDVLRTRYPRNVIVNATDVSDRQAAALDTLIAEQAQLHDMTPQDVIRHRYRIFLTNQDGTEFVGDRDQYYAGQSMAMLVFMTRADYLAMGYQSVTLGPGEALLYVSRGHIPGEVVRFGAAGGDAGGAGGAAGTHGDAGYTLSIRERLNSFETVGQLTAMLAGSYYFIVNNDQTLTEIHNALFGKGAAMAERSYYYGFDVAAAPEAQISLVSALNTKLKEYGASQGVSGLYAEGAESERASFYTLYGGLFFIGLFLGLLFIMGTVLIIYYKQVAEGYDDKERYEIMQKVGMSRAEVRKVIRSQVLAVFFLPLITAAIHVAFAFKLITRLLVVFNLTNVPLFAACTGLTVLLFAVLYIFVYALTAKTYYQIVSQVRG